MSADAVALKLPSLWTDDAETWFHQAEAQFAIRGIKEELTMFHHVVAVLTSETAGKVKDIIRKPPADQPYTALKKALLKKFEPTEHERAAAIMAITSLGDAKPSQVMDRIACLLGEHDGSILLRYHFLSIQPDYVRTPLAWSTTKDLQELAAEADRIFLSGREACAAHVCSSSSEADINRVRAKNTGRSKQKSSAHLQENLCFYHTRFGAKAHKCEAPCAFNSGNGPAGQRS